MISYTQGEHSFSYEFIKENAERKIHKKEKRPNFFVFTHFVFTGWQAWAFYWSSINVFSHVYNYCFEGKRMWTDFENVRKTSRLYIRSILFSKIICNFFNFFVTLFMFFCEILWKYVLPKNRMKALNNKNGQLAESKFFFYVYLVL